MSLTEPETQALGAIVDGLAGADPRLASMLTIFSRLAAGEQMPVREKTRARPARNRAAGTRGWAGRRPRWCWGRSSPPRCSPPRWPSPPAAPTPAPGRWEPRASRPPSRSRPPRADAGARRADMTGAAAQQARPVEPGLR